MKPFYSVVYLKPELISEEKIAVGLFLKAENYPVFDYSEEKLKVASKLIGSDAVTSVEKTFKNIKRKISETVLCNQKEAFEIEPFTKSYFNYLSDYSNNLLMYSKPDENTGNFKHDDFNRLFKLLVNNNYGEKNEKEESFKEKVYNRLKNSEIANKLNIRYRLPGTKISTIYRDHEVDYIGVNGKIVSGNSVDTTGDPYNLEYRLYLYKSLISGLNSFAKSMDLESEGHHVILYNEPNKTKNKDIIYNAKKDQSHGFELKPWEEFEKEEDWIKNHRIKKFSDVIGE